jgi:ArsR family transcriptional regulator, arsenate/arsenite/antimonite-responsive transcriptional repressor
MTASRASIPDRARRIRRRRGPPLQPASRDEFLRRIRIARQTPPRPCFEDPTGTGSSRDSSFDYSITMEMNAALVSLTALGHAKRLAVFRRLVEAGGAGRMAGDLAADLAIPGATLSFHLKQLSHAQLVESEPRGRFVCYRANFATMTALISFLTENCCADDASAACVLVAACAPGSARASSPPPVRKKAPARRRR